MAHAKQTAANIRTAIVLVYELDKDPVAGPEEQRSGETRESRYQPAREFMLRRVEKFGRRTGFHDAAIVQNLNTVAD